MRVLLGLVMAAALCACSDNRTREDVRPRPSATPRRTPVLPEHPATPVPTPLRFLVMGDTGTGNPTQHRIAEQVARTCEERGCDFLVLLGDNIYPRGACTVDDPQWETKVRAPYLSLGVSVRPVLGNHDYGGLLPDPACAQAQIDYSAVQPLWQMPARHYALDQGPALLLFLDTAPVGYGATAYLDEQSAFLRTQIAASMKPWRLAFGHSPLLSNGLEHGNAAPALDTFLRGIVCDGVDVYFSGHDHHREIFAPQAGCPVTLVVSGAAAQLGEVGSEEPSLFTRNTYGYTYVTLTPSTLTIEMIDAAEGLTDYSITLER